MDIAAHVGNIDFHVKVPAGVLVTNPFIATGNSFREAIDSATTQFAKLPKQ